ncbi:MAG: hypothetical protein HY882_06295 [Deltaproteobacteria bacterium]|nr:hypothetical protein [Deltaproteobacteria bacterium]
MRFIKMTLSIGLIFLFVFIGSSEINAQSNQALDLSTKRLRDRIQASGFITSKPLTFWGSIVGTKDASVNLSEGEVVYLKLEAGKNVQPGDQFFIARVGKAVTHPVTKKKLGRLVLMPGELTILEGKDQLVAAKIHKSFRPIYQGDLIIPPQPVLPESLPLRTPKRIEGIVLSSPEEAENITQKEILFIDRGSQEGVIVGDLFSIYQMGDYSGDVRKREKAKLPLAKVGEAVVVSVQEETCAALVTVSTQAIYIGDKVISGRE